MSFVSFRFIIFLAIAFTAYFLVPKKGRWVVLLVASYVFYFISSKWLILVMLATTMVTYFSGRAIGAVYQKRDRYIKEREVPLSSAEKKECKARYKKQAKHVMLAGVLIILGALVFLKYYGFLNDIVKDIFGHGGPALHLLLPLGISFYSLQAMAYVIDVYREKFKPDTEPLKFMLFMSYFPQIVQGPIARYRQLAAQLYEGHDFDYRRFCFGIQLILWGWIKKLIIAERAAIPVNMIFDNYTEYHGAMVFLGAALYGLQVYADFSGGMDMARGVSQVLGIEMDMNFNQPYFSTSVEDFWRRWHMTLGSWMRDYIFYPLSLSATFASLSKKARNVFGAKIGKKLPSFLAMFIVYFLVGIWHGSSWKYIAYGVYNGIFIVMGILLSETYESTRNRLGISADSGAWHVFQMVRTFVIISIGRLLSRASRLQAAFSILKLMSFRWWSLSFLTDGSLPKLGLDSANWFVLLLGIVVMLSVDVMHERGMKIRENIAEKSVLFRWLIYYAAILAVIIFGIYGPGFNSADFIYEQF